MRPPAKIYRIVVETFEPDGPTPTIPIVVHIFNGATRKQAWSYLKAHEGTDVFFRGCYRSGRWKDISCPSILTEGWVCP